MRRRSKACESCRVKRIKCAGGWPCEDCKVNGLAKGCTFREKARPNRYAIRLTIVRRSDCALSRLIGHEDKKERPRSGRSSSPGLGFVTAKPSSSRIHVDTRSAPPLSGYKSMLDVLDSELILCCFEHGKELHCFLLNTDSSTPGLPYNDLLFVNDGRLTHLAHSAPTLPSPDETDLVRVFIESPDFNLIRVIDALELQKIYARYCARPDIVSDDQISLIYSAFCSAEHHRLMLKTQSPVGWRLDNAQESLPAYDVRYYGMAREKLKSCTVPSIYALCE